MEHEDFQGHQFLVHRLDQTPRADLKSALQNSAGVM